MLSQEQGCTGQSCSGVCLYTESLYAGKSSKGDPLNRCLVALKPLGENDTPATPCSFFLLPSHYGGVMVEDKRHSRIMPGHLHSLSLAILIWKMGIFISQGWYKVERDDVCQYPFGNSPSSMNIRETNTTAV